MFLHGGWAHVIGNMLFLWVFGDNVEDAMGSARYIVFYLLAGVAASLAQVALMPEATLPTIGASGAVAGVLGAYLVMHPRAVVTVVLPLFVFFPVFQVPAFFMLGLWFLTQFTSGISSFATAAGDTGGVAWWAHIGGFIAGLFLIFLFRRRRERGWMDYYR
jgi:membrane associated rhomboid family serine protease